MPPILALILCTWMVIVLLRVEKRDSPDVSGASWIAVLWLAHCASKPLGVWFQSTAADDAAGSFLDQLWLIALLLLSFVTLARRGFNWSEAISGNAGFAILLGYMLVSILWSEIPFPSFKRWIREAQALVTAFLVLSEPDPKRALSSIFRRLIFILLPFSIMLIKYYPYLGVDYANWSGKQMWIGVTLQKNGLGRLCMFSAFFLLWRLVEVHRATPKELRDKHQIYADVSMLALALYMFKGPPNAFSATATASMLVGLGLYVGIKRLRRMGILLPSLFYAIAILAVVIYGIITPFVGGTSVAGVAGSFGRDETLTGRTDTWEEVLPSVRANPILGVGFGAFWTPAIVANVMQKEAHSGYLDVLLDLGFLGSVVIAMLLANVAVRARRESTTDFAWGTLCYCIAFMAAVHNITESSINTLRSQLTACVLLLAVTCGTRR